MIGPPGDDRGDPPSRLFASFWLAGFESASHINRAGRRVDMLGMTQHDRHAMHDYELVASLGIRTAREGLRWHLIDRGGRYDFSSVAPIVEAARRSGIQVIWSLCHYGWPDDLDLFEPAFVTRFARYAGAAATFIARHDSREVFVTPINEISFLAHAAGEVGWFSPYGRGRGSEAKRQLVLATIAGVDAIRAVIPSARIVHVDPLIHVVAPAKRPDLASEAARRDGSQFEAWEMLAGRRAPELGGHPRYLDIAGVNYYHANQWELPEARLRWEDSPRDPRWRPLHRLLAAAHARYGRPMLVAETSHFGVGRGRWIREVATEVAEARRRGVPIEGVCIYPIIDRPDWDDPGHWHHSGLWDLVPDAQGSLERVLSEPYAAAFAEARRRVAASADVA